MRSKPRIALITLVLIVFLATHAAARPALDIDVGTAIRDQTLTVTVKSAGSPVNQAIVQFIMILPGETPIPIYNQTDSAGKAVFKPPTTGTLKIIASKEGYDDDTKIISVIEPSVIETTYPPGGGGGGGVTSGEDPKNIDKREIREGDLRKDVPVSYKFVTSEIPVREIIITANLNAGMTSVQVELLKNTSTFVTAPAPGILYKNINIWVGTSGFATPKNIKEAIIKFRVENSWMSANNIEAKDVSMLRWDSTWSKIETKEISRDVNYTYFEAKTNAFSPFAIAAKVPEIVPIVTMPTPTVTPPVTPAPPVILPSSAWVYAIIAIVIIAIAAGYYLYTKKKKGA